MDEIKFRAWHRIRKEMFPVNGLYWNKGILSILDSEATMGMESEELQHVVLMQYTGFKDKNGKDIYFDDIISFIFYDKNYKDATIEGTAVVTSTLSHGVGLLYEHDENDNTDTKVDAVVEGGQIESSEEYWGDEELWFNVEIVGNIYENPELVHKKIK